MKMVSSSSPLPTPSDESSPENQKIAVAKKLASNGLFLSSSAPYYFINQTPLVLLRQPPNSKFNLQSQVTEAARAVGELHSSVASAADGCLRMLRSFASQSPIFAQLFALPSHFHNFSQMHLRPYRNLNSLSSHNFAAVLPGDTVAGVVVANGILNFLNIYNTILVVRLVLTWFPNSPPAIVTPLSTLCDPYLNIFRGIVPPLGGLDLSPILAFLVLNAFTSAASALPAELPPIEATSGSNITTTQQKWIQRLQGSKKHASGGGK